MKPRLFLLPLYIIIFPMLFFIQCTSVTHIYKAEAPSRKGNFPVAELPAPPPLLPHEEANSQKQIDPQIFSDYPVLGTLYKEHEVKQLPYNVQLQFIDRYLMTLVKKYRPQRNKTFCTTYFYDYLHKLGYQDLLDRIKETPGRTMVEKALNYEQNNGEIVILYSGWEAQQLANEGKYIAVIGEYYYNQAETIYTRHYSIVQPSLKTFTNNGERLSYPVSGLISLRNNVNGRDGTGALLAQVGVANGLVDFRWAYNSKLEGIIQRDANGKIRGGIVFIVLPDPREGGLLAMNEAQKLQ